MWFVRVSIIVHNSLNGVTWYILHYSSVLKKHQFKSLKYETASIGKQVRMHVMIRVDVDGSHIYFLIFSRLHKHVHANGRRWENKYVNHPHSHES